MIDFLHTFSPQPIAFSLGPITVHWYGLFIVLGIIVGLLVVAWSGKKTGIAKDEVYNLAFYLIIFSLLGARLYAVFLELPFYLKNPDQIIAIWNGGLAIHGALLGGVLTLFFYTKKKGQSFWLWADLIALAIPLGQALGRLGNYFNQELFGKPTDLPWGIPIEPSLRPASYNSFFYFQPTFLYESILNLINFLVLLILFSKRQKLNLRNGTIFFIYLINYGIIRMVMEFFRIDHTPIVLGIRLPILVSALLIVVGLIGILSLVKKKKTV